MAGAVRSPGNRERVELAVASIEEIRERAMKAKAAILNEINRLASLGLETAPARVLNLAEAYQRITDAKTLMPPL